VKHRKLYGLLTLAVICIILGFQNTEITSVRLLFFTIQMPVLVLILIMLILGFAIGWLAAGRKKKTSSKPAETAVPKGDEKQKRQS